MKFQSPTILALAIVGASTLHAAPDPTGPSQPAAKASIEVPLADMVAGIKTGQEKVAADARHVLHLQQQARKSKDVIKLNCVNDKLIQVKAEVNLSDRAAQAFQNANDSAKGGAYEDFNVRVDAVRRLREQADLCVGDDQVGSESANDWDGPDVQDDPFKDPFGPPLEPPGYASPIN